MLGSYYVWWETLGGDWGFDGAESDKIECSGLDEEQSQQHRSEIRESLRKHIVDDFDVRILADYMKSRGVTVITRDDGDDYVFSTPQGQMVRTNVNVTGDEAAERLMVKLGLGLCDGCGCQTDRYCADPYLLEVHGESEEKWLCESCHSNYCDEV